VERHRERGQIDLQCWRRDRAEQWHEPLRFLIASHRADEVPPARVTARSNQRAFSDPSAKASDEQTCSIARSLAPLARRTPRLARRRMRARASPTRSSSATAIRAGLTSRS
jgi:hypothetical protein